MEIIKVTRKRNKESGLMEEIKTVYQVGADFKPSAIDEICMDFIVNYCETNNEIEWLMEKVNTTEYVVTAKDGTKKVVKCNNYPFVNLRSDFVHKFFPSIIKGDKVKAPNWKDKLNKKYKK